jgi:hypothetical protein
MAEFSSPRKTHRITYGARCAVTGHLRKIILKPFATVTGRLIDEDSKPLSKITVRLRTSLPDLPDSPSEFKTDSDGRFRIAKLVGGRPYDVVYKPAGKAERMVRLNVKADENADFGDIRPNDLQK